MWVEDITRASLCSLEYLWLLNFYISSAINAEQLDDETYQDRYPREVLDLAIQAQMACTQ
jgi:hypothetical protein